MFTHKGTQELRTERLILRKFTPEDYKEMYNNWAKDERVCKFLTWNPHESEEATKSLLEIWCKDYEKPDWYQWAIVYNGKLTGSIAVVEFSEKTNPPSLATA